MTALDTEFRDALHWSSVVRVGGFGAGIRRRTCDAGRCSRSCCQHSAALHSFKRGAVSQQALDRSRKIAK